MNCITHLLIAETLYSHLQDRVKLNKKAFMYGNIKPDLSPKCLKKPHTMENYLVHVCSNAKNLMRGETGLRDFSTSLGVICHYVCDFFCRYHLDEKLFNNLEGHFLYELDLHHEFCKIMFRQKFKFKVDHKEVRENIISILAEMRNGYFSKPVTKKRDIEYAITTALWICDSVCYFAGLSVTEPQQDELVAYSPLSAAAGGR